AAFARSLGVIERLVRAAEELHGVVGVLRERRDADGDAGSQEDALVADGLRAHGRADGRRDGVRLLELVAWQGGDVLIPAEAARNALAGDHAANELATFGDGARPE